MQVKIGNTDITNYIANEGLQYTRNDVDGPNAGRALDGTMYRDRVSIKAKYTVTCRPLTTTEKNTLFTALEPEYITFSVTDDSGTKTIDAYTNNVQANYLFKINNVERWAGITFPIIER